jgi:hypothetical protein
MQKIDDCKEIRLALTRAGIATCPKKCLQTFRLVVTAQYIYHRIYRDFRRSEFKFKLLIHGTATNFLFTNGQFFKFELLKHVTAPTFPFIFDLPRPSLPYHHCAQRQVGLQLFHSGQICRPWRRLHASQHPCRFRISAGTDTCRGSLSPEPSFSRAQTSPYL